MRIFAPLLGLPVLGVVPLVSGIAMAAPPLTDSQMDRVTAGFEAYTSPCDCAAIVASVTAKLGSPAPLVSRDNFPPSTFAQPNAQNPFQLYVGVPSSQYFGFTVYNPPCNCGIP